MTGKCFCRSVTCEQRLASRVLTQPSPLAARRALGRARSAGCAGAGPSVRAGSRAAPASRSAQSSVARVAAARREPARLRRVEQVGRAAGNRGQPALRACPRPRAAGSAPSSASVYGCSGLSKRSSVERLLDDLAGVHDDDVVGGLGDDAHVVRDDDHRHLVLVRGARRAGRGRRPEPSRRARSSARRRSAASGCRRARSRSSRAGACRPRSGAGSRRGARAARGMRTSSSSSTRASCAPASARRRRCRRSVSVICVPIVSVGLSEVIGSWKIIAISRPRTSSSCALA